MVEATPQSIKLVIGSHIDSGEYTLQVLPEQAKLLLKMLQPKSLSAIETSASDAAPTIMPESLSSDEEFWKFAFLALADNGTLQARVKTTEGTREKI